MTPPTRLHDRYGAALQRERMRRGLSQSRLGKLAKLSLKYIGEIERGEGNPSMDVQDRLSRVLDWDPFQRPGQTLPNGVRTLLLTNLRSITQLAQMSAGWLERVEAAFGPEPEADAPVRRRGRPRKNRGPQAEPSGRKGGES